MSDSQPFNPDLPELRLLAQVAGLKPSAIAAALNNPEHFSEHLSAEEVSRYLKAHTRIKELLARIQAVLEAELHRNMTAKGKSNA